MSCLLRAAPPRMLNELAKGTIKTWWGDQMKLPDPSENLGKLETRLEKAGADVWTWSAFEVAAPLLAERLAIAEYTAEVQPDFGIVAPEVLSYREALEIAMKDIAPKTLSEEQQKKVMDLLRNDESMTVIH